MRTTSPRSTAARGGLARRLAALLTVPALALPLAACTGTEIPAPDAAARALVGGLQDGSLEGVEVTTDTSSDPQAQLDEILAPLLEASGAEHPSVELAKVATVEEGDDAGRRATATLKWTWALGGDAEWTYLTRAELEYQDPPEGSDGPGEWATGWTPSILAPDLAPGERIAVERVAAERGDILDGKGEPLVTTRPVWRIGIDKTRAGADTWDASARALAELVTAGGVAVDPQAYAERVAAAGPKAFVELVTVRQEGSDVDVDAARGIVGVNVIPAERELAPTSTFARPILGRSGEATAEIVEESEGRVQPGDVTGLSGLQRQYDAQLAGTAGLVVRTVPAGGDDASAEAAGTEGDGSRELFRRDAVDGTPLQTTFDVALQERAERVLADVGPASAIVAIRPSTGEVLAAASGPGSNGLNTALAGKYPPGSTFKVVDALAFARKGVAADTPVPCTPSINVNGRQFNNVPEYPASGLGDVPLRTAFAHSCNTAMISQRDKVSQQDLHDAGVDLGLGAPSALGAPAFFGNVPTDATPAQHAATMIGQDRVEASPLTMATVAASIAAGKRVEPVLVRPAEAPQTEPAPESRLTADEAAAVRGLMGAVVSDGSAGLLKDVPGIVGAKTGTAQFGDGSRQHVWMIAIADDLAVSVFVEEGDRGSSTAGPLMKAFLTGS
ncbi:penicillin-binding protein [Xylanimonas oleitrophica]|uniref:Beta-lactamase n=1 Tax=Xylanimonas oleitrophica TaxID=2607479 RepID=A0A2W5X024_9MICO|nr:penicillin-binding protein [Xylanimonas oleitrophica]